ncbi:MAG: DUF1289 domain-containing protein [Wenzhouxiangellaceae bacterium]
MSEPAIPLTEIESPCVQICRLDETGLCVGCFRTATEIAGWLGYTPEQRRRIIDELPQRAAARFADD